MPLATSSISLNNMNQLVRDSYQPNGLVRSHYKNQQQLHTSSSDLSSCHKSPSPHGGYTTNSSNSNYNNLNHLQQQPIYSSGPTNLQQQQQQVMQFPPPPPMAPLVAASQIQAATGNNNNMVKSNNNNIGANDPSLTLIVPQQQVSQQTNGNSNNNNNNPMAVGGPNSTTVISQANQSSLNNGISHQQFTQSNISQILMQQQQPMQQMVASGSTTALNTLNNQSNNNNSSKNTQQYYQPINNNNNNNNYQQQHQQQPMPTNYYNIQQMLPSPAVQQPIQTLAASTNNLNNIHIQQQPIANQNQQQQVPMTTLMIPATAAAQLQNASTQIQHAAQMAMATSGPQILVFMIPYMVPNPPTISATPDQNSLNSTLMRHSQANSSLMRSSPQHQHQHQHQHQQMLPNQFQQQFQQLSLQQQPHSQQPQALTMNSQQQQQIASSTHSLHNRAVSSLSGAKHEPEKFYIKANFSYSASRNKMELSFQKGDILHVLDTLQNNEYNVHYWLATHIKQNGKDADKGLIPDKSKADELASAQRAVDLSGSDLGNSNGNSADGSDGFNSGVLSASVGKVNFLKRRVAQRSKSLCEDNWDNVVFDIGSFKLPAYERVVYKHPGFSRPVVIFGPLADVAREKLLRDYPEKYSYPAGFNQSKDHPKVIRLKGILEVIDQGKHALLDITPSAVEKLNFVNLAPIVIFMKTDSKSIIMEFRSRAAKSLNPNARDEELLRRDGKSSRKLLEQSIKLEKSWNHVFTATLNLSTMGSEMWYRKLRETIENQQSSNVWMGEKKSEQKRHHHHQHQQLHQQQQQQQQQLFHNLHSTGTQMSHSTSTLPHSGISSSSIGTNTTSASSSLINHHQATNSSSTNGTTNNALTSNSIVNNQQHGSESNLMTIQQQQHISNTNGATPNGAAPLLAAATNSRGSAFQLYSDINQNNYHYYDLNKL